MAGESDLGIHDSHILLMCDTKEEIEAAIQRCESWAAGRKVIWYAIPPLDPDRHIILPNYGHGYVGCRLDERAGPIHLSVVRGWMEMV